MYLQDVFDKLAYVEFSNIATGKSQIGSIKQEDYPKAVSLVNSALYDIYTRLVLKKKEFDLYQRSGYTHYYLRPAHVGNVNAGDPSIYIDGTDSNFLDVYEGNVVEGDIIKLLEAYDQDGNEIMIDKRAYPDDIFLPEYDTIKILERDPLIVISIVYQAAYPKIVIEDNTFNPREYSLYIPEFILKALTSYVAAEWFTGKASAVTEGQPSINSTFTAKYEREMARIQQLMLVSDEEPEPEQFTNNGWV